MFNPNAWEVGASKHTSRKYAFCPIGEPTAMFESFNPYGSLYDIMTVLSRAGLVPVPTFTVSDLPVLTHDTQSDINLIDSKIAVD
jgi:hypothetical protein